MRDRSFAAEVAVKAVELLVEGESDLVMCEKNGMAIPMDITFALIADRMYKNKLREGDLDAFSPEQLDAMRALCDRRREEIANLYRVAQSVSF